MKAAQSLGLLCLAAFSSSAQVHEAWVSRYNGGYTSLDHRPVALALDSAGNVFVAGSSRSSATSYDYVVLKYAPDGTQSWAARYAPPAGGTNTVAAMALGQDGNTVVTGTAGTVSVGPGGAVAWAAPYSGTSVAVDTNGNVWVTGFAASEFPFGTVELDPAGSSVRTNTFDVRGLPAGSQLVGIDAAGDIYVAGWAVAGFTSWPQGTTNFIDASYWLVKYDQTGNQVWDLECLSDELGPDATVVRAMCFDAQGNVFLAGGIRSSPEGDYGKISPSGHQVWGNIWGQPTAAAVDGAGDLYLTGAETVYFVPGAFVTEEIGADAGESRWISPGLQGVGATNSQSLGIALDLDGNAYVCGVYGPAPGDGSAWVVQKLDRNGNQVWVKLYNGPISGNSGAVAIAVAPDGSIYVTGSSANASGGTDITTIKYVQDPTIQPQAGGAMLLQLPGLPGSSAGLAATTNLASWAELGPVVADTNGLFQFTDTNATLYPYRFYRWH